MENSEKFIYAYSAPQNDEVKKIRERYLPKEETKLEQLRRLDRNATQKGMAISLSIGIISCMVFGIGMCCAMLWNDALLVPGIMIGCIAFIGIGSALPLYRRITKKEKERIAPEILRLTDELLAGQS